MACQLLLIPKLSLYATSLLSQGVVQSLTKQHVLFLRAAHSWMGRNGSSCLRESCCCSSARHKETGDAESTNIPIVTALYQTQHYYFFRVDRSWTWKFTHFDNEEHCRWFPSSRQEETGDDASTWKRLHSLEPLTWLILPDSKIPFNSVYSTAVVVFTRYTNHVC